MTETTASLSWGPGMDNHSPILSYTIQARTPFSLGWQAVTTGRLVSSDSLSVGHMNVLVDKRLSERGWYPFQAPHLKGTVNNTSPAWLTFSGSSCRVLMKGYFCGVSQF